MAAIHEMLDGEVQLFRRPNSSYWQCSAVQSQRRRQAVPLKHQAGSLAQAKDVAEDWLLTLKG